MKAGVSYGYPPCLMPADEAARYVGMSKSAFLVLVDKGSMPRSVPMPLRLSRWDQRDLQNWIDEQREKAASRNDWD